MSSTSYTTVIWDNLKQIFAAVIMAVIIKTSIVEAYKIPSESMKDTLLVGDFLLANKMIYGSRLPLVDWRLPAFSDPEPGDVVIFIWPRDGVTKYIKRCIGKPGDTIEVREKVLYVNGELFDNPELSINADTLKNGEPRFQVGTPRDNFGPYVVPDRSYFMMGDNRDNSYDSRFWGPVREEYILGEAMMIHWSWDDESLKPPEVSKDDPLSVPRMFVYNAIHFFEKVRWSRLISIID